MTADALTDAQREQALPFVDAGGSWGLATGVYDEGPAWCRPLGLGRRHGHDRARRPERDTVGVLLTQRTMTSALDGFGDFWTAVAEAA